MDADKLYILDRINIDPDTGCWLWALSRNLQGYGKVAYTNKIVKKYHTPAIHRLSYLVFVGPISEGLLVRHSCRNRHCCNPDHLSLGTSKDNFEDRVRDGTFPEGELGPGSKLKEAEVLQIRALYGTMPNRVLAEMYQVSTWCIEHIAYRRSWKHI